MVRWFGTPGGLRFYAVDESISADGRVQAVTSLSIRRVGKLTRLVLAKNTVGGLMELRFDQLPPAWQAAFHDYFWRTVGETGDKPPRPPAIVV